MVARVLPVARLQQGWRPFELLQPGITPWDASSFSGNSGLPGCVLTSKLTLLLFGNMASTMSKKARLIIWNPGATWAVRSCLSGPQRISWMSSIWISRPRRFEFTSGAIGGNGRSCVLHCRLPHHSGGTPGSPAGRSSGGTHWRSRAWIKPVLNGMWWVHPAISLSICWLKGAPIWPTLPQSSLPLNSDHRFYLSEDNHQVRVLFCPPSFADVLSLSTACRSAGGISASNAATMVETVL